MKSLRIESCPSGVVFMVFSFYSLLHDHLCGMAWLCQINELLMACMWFKVFNIWLSLWYQHGCMVLAPMVLAMCYVICFEDFVKERIRSHSLLVWFEMRWILEFLKLLCMIIWRIHMHVRLAVSCGLVLLFFNRVLVSWLWRYLEMESWRLWSVGLLIQWNFKDCGGSSCSVYQIHGGDGLSRRQYIVWSLIGDRDWNGNWVFTVYTVELELLSRIWYGSTGLLWRIFIIFVSSLGPYGLDTATYFKRFRFPNLIIVEL